MTVKSTIKGKWGKDPLGENTPWVKIPPEWKYPLGENTSWGEIPPAGKYPLRGNCLESSLDQCLVPSFFFLSKITLWITFVLVLSQICQHYILTLMYYMFRRYIHFLLSLANAPSFYEKFKKCIFPTMVVSMGCIFMIKVIQHSINIVIYVVFVCLCCLFFFRHFSLIQTTVHFTKVQWSCCGHQALWHVVFCWTLRYLKGTISCDVIFFCLSPTQIWSACTCLFLFSTTAWMGLLLWSLTPGRKMKTLKKRSRAISISK